MGFRFWGEIGVLFILFPHGWVGFDVDVDAIVFVIVPNDVFVIVALPQRNARGF